MKVCSSTKEFYDVEVKTHLESMDTCIEKILFALDNHDNTKGWG